MSALSCNKVIKRQLSLGAHSWLSVSWVVHSSSQCACVSSEKVFAVFQSKTFQHLWAVALITMGHLQQLKDGQKSRRVGWKKINSILLQVKMCLAQRTPKQLKGSQFNLHHFNRGTSSVPASHWREKSKSRHYTLERSWFIGKIFFKKETKNPSFLLVLSMSSASSVARWLTSFM